jgi:hypothetical protein
MTRSLAILLASLLAIGLLLFGSLAVAGGASAATRIAPTDASGAAWSAPLPGVLVVMFLVAVTALASRPARRAIRIR